MDVPPPVDRRSTRFLDQFRLFIRSRGLAYHTEKTYCLWVRRFIRFNSYQSAKGFNTSDIAPSLSHLSEERHCSVNTQRTALNALSFLFREFLKQEIPQLQFRKAGKLPTVLSRAEAAAIITQLDGLHRLAGQMMYGCGLRLMEAARLRVKDIDFENRGIWVPRSLRPLPHIESRATLADNSRLISAPSVGRPS